MDPRVAASRAAVIKAGVELVAEGGVRAFSIDAVVARSGVAKTTVYRHWPKGRDLLNEVFDSFESHTPTPDAGSLRGDLQVLLRHFVKELAGADWPKSLTSLIGEAEHDDVLAEAHRQHVHTEMTPYREVLQRAIDRGEIPPVDVELASEHLVGALFMRRLVQHGTSTRKEADRLLDFILNGLLPRTDTP